MRLLQRRKPGAFSLTDDLIGDDPVPPYAILSHTWVEGQEVTYQDIVNGTGTSKAGYNKLKFCAEQAEEDSLEHFWVDTCCIDKSNHVELSREINDMFRHYRGAKRCYVYMSDVLENKRKAEQLACDKPWEEAFRASRWFTRGWTLQELLAPRSVEFFSGHGKKLGNKESLEQQIHEITGIPKSALRGERLSAFTTEERFSWATRRETGRPEDQVYSLLGIFDVQMPLYYGEEGAEGAHRRLQELIDKRERCMQDLRLSDPRDDKKRIEETKGGLLEDSYGWILSNSSFRQWQNAQQNAVLWVKGDPGKGKTMLLCGTINELNKIQAKTNILCYFFCQATDERINTSTSVLRGLIYMLVCQQPSLISHVRKKYDVAGKKIFEDANAWFVLQEIFVNMLQDPSRDSLYVIIDALDECIEGLPKLLSLIIEQSGTASSAKWVLSSRNWPQIEQRLDKTENQTILSLELNTQSVSKAVDIYTKHKVSELAERHGYDHDTQLKILRHLSCRADDTFLWVALVCQSLEEVEEWDVLDALTKIPAGLPMLYHRMLKHIHNSSSSKACQDILAITVHLYRPVTLFELMTLVDLPQMSNRVENLSRLVKLCGSFLTIQDHTIYFIHQSAKDFLLKDAIDTVCPSGKGAVHHTIFTRSLRVMSCVLRRDIYSLEAPGYPSDKIARPDPDPLAALQYACVSWIDHFCEWLPSNCDLSSEDQNRIHTFIQRRYLYWLEASSLFGSMTACILSMARLEAILSANAGASALSELVKDARRFAIAHRTAIEQFPLQTYASALLFSPERSLIRNAFKTEEPTAIEIKPPVNDEWSRSLHTLDHFSGLSWTRQRGHSDPVAFSHDSALLASTAGYDIKIWDTSSGKCIRTIVCSGPKNFAFSHDSTRLASSSLHSTDHIGGINVWDVATGACLQILLCGRGHSSITFSHDSARLGSRNLCGNVQIWDIGSGTCLYTFQRSDFPGFAPTFAQNLTWLASRTGRSIIEIWDISSGACVKTLRLEDNSPAVFSNDLTIFASSANDGVIQIWDIGSGKCLKTLEGHEARVTTMASSHNFTLLASASDDDNMIKIWDVSSGKCLKTFRGHAATCLSLTFSHDLALIAYETNYGTIEIWETEVAEESQTTGSHVDEMHSAASLHDRVQLSSPSHDGTVKLSDMGHDAYVHTAYIQSERLSSRATLSDTSSEIRDTSSGERLSKLQSHYRQVHTIAFLPGSTRLVSSSNDLIVKTWDVSSGRCIETFEGWNDGPCRLRFSYDWRLLALPSDSKTIKIWEMATGRCVQTLTDAKNPCRMTFSRDSTRLACMWDDISIWDTGSGKCLQRLECLSRFEEDERCVWSSAFSYDASQLALGLLDNTVEIWDAGSGMRLQTCIGHLDVVESITFSHDSTRLASGSEDETIKIWDTSSGECLRTIDLDQAIDEIAFDVNDRYLLTEIGTIDTFESSATQLTQGATTIHQASDQGIGVSPDSTWITYNSKNVLWLPPEYRPRRSAISEKTIAMGTRSGKVWMCLIEE